MMSIATMYPAQSLAEPLFDFDDPQSLFMYECPEIKIESDPDSYMDSSPIYTDLTSAKCTLSPPRLSLLKQNKTGFADSVENLLSWTTKHPEHWSQWEVLDWVYYIADEMKLDGSKLCGENYQDLTGYKLCRMSREEFVAADPSFGSTMYDLFRKLIDKARFSEPAMPEAMKAEHCLSFDTTLLSLGMDVTGLPCAQSSSVDLSVFFDEKGVKVGLEGNLYDIDIAAKIELPDTDTMDNGYVSGGSDLDHERRLQELPRCISSNSDTSDEEEITSPTVFNPQKFFDSARRGPSPSLSSDDGCDMEERAQFGKRKTTTSKGNHLWEFIRDLLKDSKLNPSLLRWEDKEAGVFRFVQSEAVAKMWGRKKNNPGMTYEKLSRAMRFCRSAGYFSDVPKNGKFPKKLCFKFGPKAHDWKD